MNIHASRGGRRPTLVEVARLAGVSHMTVSRYLSGSGNVHEASRKRIDDAIAALDYRPNLVARSLRKRREGLLALIVPATTNPFSPARILSSSTAAAHEYGYEVEVVMVDGDAEIRARRALELSDSGLVEGILSLAPLAAGTIDRLRDEDAPVAVFEVYDDELRGAGVLLDATPIAQFVEGLAGLGHSRFAYLGGPASYPAAVARETAYISAVERLELESAGVLARTWVAAEAHAAVAALPDAPGFTALVCANDELAGAAMKAAVDRGWRIPETLSVTGWDNDRLSEYLPTALSTVHIAHDLLGRHAVDVLVARLEGTPEPAFDPSERLNTLVWRASTAPPGGTSTA